MLCHLQRYFMIIEHMTLRHANCNEIENSDDLERAKLLSLSGYPEKGKLFPVTIFLTLIVLGVFLGNLPLGESWYP